MNEIKFTSQTEIHHYQLSELRKLLTYLNSHSPYYQSVLKKNNIATNSLNSLKDLEQLPVTTKQDIQNCNWDFLCVEKSQIIEYCNTSGTLGAPVTIALTENDLQRLSINEFHSFKNMEATSNDVILLMLSLDRQFMAGIAYYEGARELGAGIIRGGPGNFMMQLETIQRLKPTILIAVPSFIVNLISYAKEKNIDLNKTSVKKILCIGENIKDENLYPNAISNRITNAWHVQLFSTYASTEQQTAFTECGHGKGGHHQPSLVYFEILDDQNKQLPSGEFGELTITTLGVEGMPLLRYKTGDICTYFDDPCACGRITSRISPIVGRKNQLIKYKGTTLYPQTIFNILNSIEKIEEYVIETTKNDLGLDDLKIIISVMNNSEEEDKKIKQLIQSALRVVPELKYASTSEILKLQISEGKRKLNKFIDNR